MKNNHTLSNRLKTYSSMASIVLGAAAASGEVVVTDVDPDYVFDSYGDYYLLDLNNDGTAEFTLNMLTNSYPAVFMGAAGIVTSASINASTGSSGAYFYPIVNNLGDFISAGDVWYGYVGGLMTMASVSYYFTGEWANWFDVTDGYMALRFQADGDTHYGWVRLDASPDGFQFTLRDYAYNSTPDEAICIGDVVGPADDCINALETVTWVGNLDIADNGNGLDLGFSFNQSPTEYAITEYRVIAVKSAAAPGFDLAAAESMTGDQFVSIAPTGIAVYASAFTATSTDSDGDLITFGVPYKLFVLSESDGYPSVLSLASTEITLSAPVAVSNLLDNGLNVYPNPATNFIMVDCDINSVISIFNANGGLIREVKNTGEIEKISIDDLPAGNYFIKIAELTNTRTLKFIKQ